MAITLHPPSPERLHQEMDKRAPFVLITNVPASELSAWEVLAEYKAQPAVERRFAFLKDPVIVTGVYLNARTEPRRWRTSFCWRFGWRRFWSDASARPCKRSTTR